MNFNFKESLSKGQTSASLVLKSQQEMKKIYKELTEAFNDYFGFNVSLYDRIDYKGADSDNSLTSLGAAINIWANPERVKTGYTILLLGTEARNVKDITLFKYKESDDVYPVTVLFNKEKILCYNQDEFADVIKKVLENPRVNLDLIEFKNQIEEIKKEIS